MEIDKNNNNYSGKACPRCKIPLHPNDGKFELTRRGVAGSEASPGFLVSVYSCPKCGYTELYNLRVTGRY